MEAQKYEIKRNKRGETPHEAWVRGQKIQIMRKHIKSLQEMIDYFKANSPASRNDLGLHTQIDYPTGTSIELKVRDPRCGSRHLGFDFLGGMTQEFKEKVVHVYQSMIWEELKTAKQELENLL